MSERKPDPALMQECAELLEELAALPTPGTREEAGQAVVARELAKICPQVSGDIYGNVTGVLNPTAPTRLLLTAHIDEIGMMVRHIDAQGYLYVAAMGGSRPDVLVGQRVTIHNRRGAVNGVIGRNQGPAPKDEITMERLWIDIGVDSREAAEALVRLGDPVTVSLGVTRLAGDRVTARALDDRAGVVALVVALRLIARQAERLQVAVHALSATQEEGGQHRGAIVGAATIKPHACLAIDMGYATDVPRAEPRRQGNVNLGEGPMLSHSLTVNRRVLELLETTAAAQAIPMQYAVEPRATGTDGDTIASSGQGVATGVVSVPCRYMHSPSEVIALMDLAWTAELVAEFALGLPARPDFRPFALPGVE